MKILIFILLFSINISAQETARKLSNVFLGANIIGDSIHQYKDKGLKKGLMNEGCKIGLSIGFHQLSTLLIHKNRPDMSDDNSFYSGHTSMAFATSGWNTYVGFSIGIGTGYMRVEAKKHYPIDVISGAVTGITISKICGE